MRLCLRDLRFEHGARVTRNRTGQRIVEVGHGIAHRIKIRIASRLDVRGPGNIGGPGVVLLPPVDLILPEVRGQRLVQRQVVLQARLRTVEQDRKRIVRPCRTEHARIGRRAFAP